MSESFPTENAISRENGGGGNRTRAPFPTDHHRQFVYFIQHGDDGPIKVGVSSYAAGDRLKQLQVSNPVELHVVGGFYTTHGHGWESEIHRVLAPHRVRGEWFLPVPELFEVMEYLTDDANRARLMAEADARYGIIA